MRSKTTESKDDKAKKAAVFTSGGYFSKIAAGIGARINKQIIAYGIEMYNKGYDEAIKGMAQDKFNNLGG